MAAGRHRSSPPPRYLQAEKPEDDACVMPSKHTCVSITQYSKEEMGREGRDFPSLFTTEFWMQVCRKWVIRVQKTCTLKKKKNNQERSQTSIAKQGKAAKVRSSTWGSAWFRHYNKVIIPVRKLVKDPQTITVTHKIMFLNINALASPQLSLKWIIKWIIN